MQTYELWESNDSLVLLEEGHAETSSLTKGCTLVKTFQAKDWDEAYMLARVYERKGIAALEMRLAS